MRAVLAKASLGNLSALKDEEGILLWVPAGNPAKSDSHLAECKEELEPASGLRQCEPHCKYRLMTERYTDPTEFNQKRAFTAKAGQNKLQTDPQACMQQAGGPDAAHRIRDPSVESQECASRARCAL